MSIYPVHLASWYPKTTSKPRPKEWDSEMKGYSETAVDIVKSSRCVKCKKKCSWKKAWGHHSIPWGYGDIWCSKKCLKG